MEQDLLMQPSLENKFCPQKSVMYVLERTLVALKRIYCRKARIEMKPSLVAQAALGRDDGGLDYGVGVAIKSRKNSGLRAPI